MKISELKRILDSVENDLGDMDLGLKILIDNTIHIVEIAGVSSSGFEGVNLTNELDEDCNGDCDNRS